MLKLGKYIFEEDSENSCLTVYIGDRKNGSEWNVDCFFKKAIYEERTVSPEIIINNIHTRKYDIRGLSGEKFSTRSLDESMEREDSLYLFESEPFHKMKIKITETDKDKAHILCKGIAVEDGYATPMKTVSFTWDCWLPLVVEKLDLPDQDARPGRRSADTRVVKINGFGHAKLEDLTTYEKESGFIFPEDYKKFLLEYNGGTPETKQNHIDTDLFHPSQRIDYFYGITKVDVYDETALNPKYNLFSKYAKNKNLFDMKHSIFIASVYGQYSFCLFVGEERSGVYYYDISEGENRVFHKFCDTFTDFLNHIVTEEP